MWTSHEIDANGLTIHYLRSGGSGPPLVLAHGATDNGGCWVRLATALAATFDVIAPDARGHGRTTAPDASYDAVTMGDDLAAFITALGLEHPFVGGHSMGANTTLALIANHPHLARAAFLEDPVFRIDVAAEHEIETFLARMRTEFEKRRTQTHADIVAHGTTSNPHWDASEFEPWAHAKQEVNERFLFQTGPQTPFDWRDLLPHVICPTLLVTADAPPIGNGIVNQAASDVARALCPTLEVAHIPGAGHNVRREQFGPFLSAVGSFLATHH